MAKSDFFSAIKQKLVPSFNTVPSVSSQNSITGQTKPQAAMASDSAVRLGLAEILAPGGIQSVIDISTQYWFSANQPIKPVAPAAYRPRQRAFMPGENQIWTRGQESGVTFQMLRDLADSWDLLRIVIETRKDQMCSMNWEIRAKQKTGETNVDLKARSLADPNIKKLTAFFNFPDGFHNWKTWLRMWFEDMLVLDAVALYYQRDQTGKIANVSPIDGSTISKVLTDLGTTPPPPSVAYQQVVYGSPACDLTTNDLLYAMRNERTWRRYGYGPVEQILVTIGIGLRKEAFLADYYTSGNMPEALCFLPSNLSPDRITDIQNWFDSVLAGDLSKRRRLTFLPGYGTGTGSDSVRPNIVFPKEVLLKDELDDWLMRIVCYAFSVSPQNMMKQMNRASAEQAATVSQEEGLEPAMTFVCDICNQIIHDLGMDQDYEFAYQEQRDTDPVQAANVDNILLGKVVTVNETREARGLDRRSEPECDMIGIFSPTGFIPISTPSPQAMQAQQTQFEMDNPDQDQDQYDQPGGQQKLLPATTLEKVTDLKPGDYVHPVFGDLSKVDKFFAYDKDNDTILVKGLSQDEIKDSVKQFVVEYPQYADKVKGIEFVK